MESDLSADNFKYSPLLDPRESAAPEVNRLYDWWLERKGERELPAWSDVDVVELKPWMGWLTVYGIAPDQSDAKFRLVGSHFAKAAGYDLTGRMLSEGSYTCTPAIVMTNLRRIIGHRHACLQSNKILTLRYHYAKPSDRLWLPFAEEGQPVDRIMLYYHKVEIIAEEGYQYFSDPRAAASSGTV